MSGNRVWIRAIILAVPLVSCLFQPSFSEATVAGVVKVRVEGSAPGTTPSSRDAALRVAGEQAIRLWVEALLGAAPARIVDPLVASPELYIESTRILSVDLDDGDIHVDAEVYLHEWPLRADVAMLVFRQRRRPPRVAFLVLESRSDEAGRSFQDRTRTQTSLVKVFESKGFGVVAPKVGRGGYSERELFSISEGGLEALARFGAENKADAVVFVEVIVGAARASDRGELLRARADIDAQVVRVRDARLIDQRHAEAEVSTSVPENGIQFATEDAVYKLRDVLIVAAAIATAEDTVHDHIDLMIENAPTWDSVQRIADSLGTISGVDDVQVVSVRSGEGRIRFAYEGSMARLVEGIERGGGSSPPLEVVRVVGQDMRFRLLSP